MVVYYLQKVINSRQHVLKLLHNQYTVTQLQEENRAGRSGGTVHCVVCLEPSHSVINTDDSPSKSLGVCRHLVNQIQQTQS